MWCAFNNSDATADLTDAFHEQQLNRRAFFQARRELVRITGKINRPLTSD
jgi:hypothetical protein